MHHACAAAAGPSLIPLQAHPNLTTFSTLKSAPSTLKSAPSSPLQGLRATIFSVELGARSCNLLGCPPHLSPTAQKSRDPTQSPWPGDREDILCVLQDRVLLSDISVTHCCGDAYVETAAATAGSAAEVRAAKKVAKYALREPGGYDFTPSWSNPMVANAPPRIHS